MNVFLFSEDWLEGTPDSQGCVNSWRFLQELNLQSFLLQKLFFSGFVKFHPTQAQTGIQPKHSAGTICTYLRFFPFVAPSFVGQSQLPWSWFLGFHFSVSHFLSLVIVWELPTEWEPRQVLPSLIFPFQGDPALHCLLSCVKTVASYTWSNFPVFSDNIVPNWPTMSWQKLNSRWHMFLRHLGINYSNRRQGQNCCFVFTVSCLFSICLFLWK